MANVKEIYEALGQLLKESPEIATKDVLEGGGNSGTLNIFREGPGGKITFVSFEDEEYMKGYIDQAEEYISELNAGELSEQHKEYLVQMCIEERSEKEILQYIKDHTVSVQKGKEYNIFEDYTASEIEQMVFDYVQEAIKLADMSDDVVIKGVKVYGSRTREDYQSDSDLDVLVEYEGDFKEDMMFNLLHDEDEPFVLGDISVDINPIREEESGTIEEYYSRVCDFHKERSESVKNKSLDEMIAQKEQENNANPDLGKIKVYGLTVTDSEGFCGEEITGKESLTELFTSEKECLDYAYEEYVNDFDYAEKEGFFEDSSEKKYNKKEFIEDIKSRGYVVTQLRSCHWQYEYFEKELEVSRDMVKSPVNKNQIEPEY